MLDLLKKILELVSPQLREAIKKSIADDILVLFIKKILGF